jgi:hypothetical protein
MLLQGADKSELIAVTTKHGAAQALAKRLRIVIASAADLYNKRIAAKAEVCSAMAGSWRNRLAKNWIDGLYNEPRSGAPREIGDDETAGTIYIHTRQDVM